MPKSAHVLLLILLLVANVVVAQQALQAAEDDKVSEDDKAKQAEQEKMLAAMTPEERAKWEEQQKQQDQLTEEERAKLAEQQAIDDRRRCRREGQSCSSRRRMLLDDEKTCCPGLVCSRGECKQSGGGGDPHFIGLDGSAYDFHGISNLHFNLVSEPESQANALFHNLNMGESTFIKALGLQHTPSGHQVTVDTGLEDCVAGVPPAHVLSITVDGNAINPARLRTITHPAVNGTLVQLLKDRTMTADYRASHGTTNNTSEHVTLRTDRLMYTIHRQAGACHLDVDMAILDPVLLGERATTMHGVLGQTARWASSQKRRQPVEGDEADYIESGLLSRDSKFVKMQALPASKMGRSMVEVAGWDTKAPLAIGRAVFTAAW